MQEFLKKIISNKVTILVLVILVGFASGYLLGKDNPIEEYSETVIKEQIGVDIDLSPNSSEQSKDVLSSLTKYGRFK